MQQDLFFVPQRLEHVLVLGDLQTFVGDEISPIVGLYVELGHLPGPVPHG